MYTNDAPKATLANCAASPMTRQTQVEEQMNQLDNALYRLADLATALEGRLAAVTVDPADGCGEICKETQLVPLADNLRNFVRRSSHIESRISDLLARIEL